VRLRAQKFLEEYGYLDARSAGGVAAKIADL
jgi:hypothetical protein